MKTEYTIVVATRKTGARMEFLMVQNAERGWELPGGKFELNEGPVRCALREFIEETGHFLEHPRALLKQERANGLAHIFTGELGAVVPNFHREAKFQRMDWFQKLPEELAFPDDPYEEIGDALGIQFR